MPPSTSRVVRKPRIRASRPRPSRWRFLRYGAWSVLALVLLLLATMSSFYVYAETRQDASYRDAAPASGRFVQAGDVEMFVQERGPVDGPAVVLVHGTGAWSGLWVETMDALAAEGHRVVALDLPPFGFSQKPVDGAYATTDQARRISGALDALGLPNVTLVAHSFGSRAAMEAVLAQPERFDRVVLVDAALDFNATEDRRNPILKGFLALRPLRNLLVASTVENPLLTRVFLEQLIHNDSAATDARVAILQQPLVVEGLTADAGLWLDAFLAPERPNLSNDPASYARLGMPVLVLWGAEDTVTPVERGAGLAALIPGARLQVLAGVGHIPQIEDPPAFQAALLAFLGPTA